MTVQELSQLYYLNKNIARDEKELERLEAQKGTRSPALSDMPHAHNNESEVERLATEIVDLQKLIRTRVARRISERHRLETYINAIEDEEIAYIFELRFVDCMSWAKVADALGGGNTSDSVKKMCYRYLDKHEG